MEIALDESWKVFDKLTKIMKCGSKNVIYSTNYFHKTLIKKLNFYFLMYLNFMIIDFHPK